MKMLQKGQKEKFTQELFGIIESNHNKFQNQYWIFANKVHT